MSVLEYIGFFAVAAFPSMLLLSALACLLEKSYAKVQILAGLCEYLMYRREFHKWRKEAPELTSSGDRPPQEQGVRNER